MSQNPKFNELVWHDEFEGEGSPDPSKWAYDLGTGQGGWGNNEVQNYTNDRQNVRLSSGKLVIEANKVNGNWSSARIKTQGKYSFTYGRIEFRAKLPKGSGTWPALWMLGENITTKGWPACGEIDVMEHVGRDPGKIHGTLHTPSSFGNSQNSGTIMVEDFADNFHVYAAEWTEESIKFYVDGTLFYTYAPANKDNATWPFTNPQFIIINLAMGGNFGSDTRYETNGQKNGIDPALSTARFEVDYVRVYQPFSSLQLSGPSTIAPNAKNVVFKASDVANASYTWQLPQGASIVNGAGTNEVKVDWGNTSGKVKVEVTIDGQRYQKEMQVNVTQDPVGETFIIEDFTILPTAQLSSSGGTFNFNNQSEALDVSFSVTNPSSLPQIVYNLASPLNITTHPVVGIRLKTLNKSGTIVLRADLIDTNGKVTGTSKAFTLTPLIDDGEYFTYYFDYSSIFGTGNGQVDGSKIAQIRILVNYGIFGSPGSDTFSIDNFSVSQALPNTPTRPSHLTLTKAAQSITLYWKDNSQNESVFNVYRSRSENEAFTKIASLSRNVQEYNDNVSPEENFIYRISAANEFGESNFSNKVAIQGNALSIAEPEVSPLVVLYPNPCTDYFIIKKPISLRINSIALYDLQGRGVMVKKLNAEDMWGVNASPGVYFCYLHSSEGVLVKRLLII